MASDIRSISVSGDPGWYALADGGIAHFGGSGLLHNSNGPAILLPDGTREWWQHGVLHRKNGFAIKRPSGICESWDWGSFESYTMTSTKPFGRMLEFWRWHTHQVSFIDTDGIEAFRSMANSAFLMLLDSIDKEISEASKGGFSAIIKDLESLRSSEADRYQELSERMDEIKEGIPYDWRGRGDYE